MAKFSIGVTAGVAAIYPEGQPGLPVVTFAGDPAVVFSSDGEAKAKKGETIWQVLKDKDEAAPAAGVAPDEPYGKRSGTIQVKVEEGDVDVRQYTEGTNFVEETLRAGEDAEYEVTEANRITIAVYV